jgi:hypothetical protein
MIVDMEAHETSDRLVEIDDRFLAEWVEYGMAELSAYLAKYARFADWCDGRERDDQ